MSEFPADEPIDAPRRQLESPVTLSQSMIWQVQRGFFEQQGVEAWRQAIVPQYVTSNPFIANAYVQMVLGYLRDLRARSAPPGDPGLDPREPLYLLELGAGSGRFGFHFLTRFFDLLPRSMARNQTVTYLMTDLSERMVAHWAEHPAFKPWVQRGQLDFARFDPLVDQTLTLRHSGTVVSARTVRNPLVAIANYFFDGIPQDLFFLHAGQIDECLASVNATEPDPDLSSPTALERLDVTFHRRPVSGAAYRDAELQEILDGYRQRLRDSHLLFPVGAIQTLRHLLHLSGGRMLVLSADKGYHRESELDQRGEPEIVRHGSISMSVNYHAMGEYVRRQGGEVLNSSHRHLGLDVVALLVGGPAGGYVDTALAFDEWVEHRGPDDFFLLNQALRRQVSDLTLQQILAFLRLSGWDGRVFLRCQPTLLERVDSASESWRREVLHATERVWESYFPIGEQEDLAFQIGALLYRMDAFRDALRYFARSRDSHGSDAGTLYNQAACHHALGELEAALTLVADALLLEPTLEPALELREQIQSTLASSRQIDGHSNPA